MSIFDYNGGSIVAMAGKDCVGIACDRRIGAQLTTLATNFQRVFKLQDNLLIGLAGLATDVQTFHAFLEFRLNLYKLREGKDMKPTMFANMVSTALYEKRFGPYFVTPIVIGLEDNKPVICTYDSIGAIDKDNFAVGGTGAHFFQGCCESFYKEGLNKDDLEEILAQTLVSGCDRDAFSGWGGVVYIMQLFQCRDQNDLKIKELQTKQS